ncbi:MbcA/ParS/Xre antitoxin family protein [Limnobacter sp. P1]|uniref:MbcA/ParS/Xre antitoxin family protein n=1 Tax=Limnobacter olei TaxID=3031298 RepID=UPI0023AEA39A|nr:MbcA/ParS/Xre antitoxin family protein [Limnobacter sp. P1]
MAKAFIHLIIQVMSEKDMIFKVWGLSTGDSTRIIEKVCPETLEKSLLTIHRYLCFLFPQEEVRNNWMRRSNGAFGGQRPIDLILEEGDRGLVTVENYLAGAMQR